VNSDNLKTGDMISISVSESVKVDGVVVFKKGSTGVLNIAKSVKSGGHGRAGRLEIDGGRINDAFGNTHPINVSISSKGNSKRGWAIVSSVLGVAIILIPFGIWIDGTPATVQGGQYEVVPIVQTEFTSLNALGSEGYYTQSKISWSPWFLGVTAFHNPPAW
jgi:hypothetical protein